MDLARIKALLYRKESQSVLKGGGLWPRWLLSNASRDSAVPNIRRYKKVTHLVLVYEISILASQSLFYAFAGNKTWV
jgi:hypothetical protein